ncbi:MAG: TolC family protein [Phycisphaerae bacterium]|nr:TolC family protein [Phycisphaerae bacterium]
MFIPRPLSPRRLAQYVRILLPSLLLTSCASLDPQPDITTAADLASSRVDAITQDAWSQPVDTPSTAWNGSDPLHADVALAVAIQNNPRLRLALTIIAQRRADVVQAGLLPNPTIGFGIGVAIDGLAGAPALVQGLQTLTWIWTQPDRIAIADAQLQSAILDAASQTVALAEDVGIAHAAVLAAANLHTYDTAYVDVAAKTLRLIRARLDAGETSMLNVNRAEVDLQTARTDGIASRRSLEQTKLALLRAMGWPGHTTDWEAAEPTAATCPETDSDLELLQLAATQNLELASHAAKIEQYVAAHALATTKKLPEVTFTFGWQNNFGSRRAVMPGAQITIPLFDNGDPAIAKANAQLEHARLQWIATANQIEYEVRNTASQWREAAEQVSITANSLVPSAASALRRSQFSHAEGVTDLTVLLLAQEHNIDAERTLVTQRLAECTSLIRLRRAVGGTFKTLHAPYVASKRDDS